MRRFRPYRVLFVAAAMLNVLVAWGCVLWSPYTRHSAPSEQRTEDGWPATIVGPNGEQAWWHTADGFGVSEAVPHGARGSEDGFAYFRGTHTPAYYRGGWPMRSMQSIVRSHDYLERWDLPAREIFRRGMQTSWLPAWMHARDSRRLPMVPFWPGFAINTLLYFAGLVAFQFVSLPIVKRSHVREEH